MGVYIPKMEKPTDCGDCDFYRWGYCHVKHARVECEDGVDADCPLVSVTEPHGRLIDADVCKQRVYDGSRTPYKGCPTVIEAEGE